MIAVEAAIDKQGLLRSCRIKGHADSGPMGHDLVCAAVSVLARTAITVLRDRPDITLRVYAPRRGDLYFETDYEAAGAAVLSTTAMFLLEGIKSVAADYPVNCSLKITKWRN